VVDNADGSVVFVDSDGGTLRISPSGKVIFRAAADGAGESTALSAMNTAYELCESCTEQYRGESSLTLTDFAYDAASGQYSAYFDYSVNGVPILLSGGHAATVTVAGGGVVYAEITMRSYTSSGAAAMLPERHAFAIVAASGGGEPLLIYPENGDAGLEPCWVVNS